MGFFHALFLLEHFVIVDIAFRFIIKIVTLYPIVERTKKTFHIVNEHSWKNFNIWELSMNISKLGIKG